MKFKAIPSAVTRDGVRLDDQHDWSRCFAILNEAQKMTPKKKPKKKRDTYDNRE